MCHVTSSDQWQVVKSLSLSLGLPTVTTTMGEEGDIRWVSVMLIADLYHNTTITCSEWTDLTPAQTQYLVQVRILASHWSALCDTEL